MLSRQFITDMCRLSTMAYRENSFISDLFSCLDYSRPDINEVCVLDQCHSCPSLIQGDLSEETDIIQNDAQAYACRYQDSLAIVFRGTESFRDVLTDLNVIRVRMDLPGHTGDSRPKVHWGFLRQFRTVEEQVKEHIESYIQECDKHAYEKLQEEKEQQEVPSVKADPNDDGVGVGKLDNDTSENNLEIETIKLENNDKTENDKNETENETENVESSTSEQSVATEECEKLVNKKTENKKITKKFSDGTPIKHVVFSGHSLGGALATLAAVQFAKQYPDIVVSCVTFGSPRVGNGSFAQMFNKCCKGSFRFVNEDDPVPMGPTPIRFTHVKGGQWIDDDQLLLQKPWMRSLTFFKNLFLSFLGVTHNPMSDHGCLSYLKFISNIED